MKPDSFSDSPSTRATAARILATIITEKKTIDQLIPDTIADLYNSNDRSFIQELCYGVLRWYYQLEFILNELLDKAIRAKDTELKTLLLCGLYQMDHLRTPDHASVSATVEAASDLNRKWAKQMINALLRRYQREGRQIQKLIHKTKTPSAYYAHPDWLISLYQNDWPNHWQGILESNNKRPPMHLRVNTSQIDRNDYIRDLKNAGLSGSPSTLIDCGVILDNPVDVESLPGFRSGHISVQDIGAQLAVSLLDLKTGYLVLDACAAPGGKTAHICEAQPNLKKLIAVEYDKRRIDKLHNTQQRLKHCQFDIVQADASDTGNWWDGNQFDRILLDVPCSATGVIRRHPDIKLLRNAEMIPRFVSTQYELLTSVWPLLKNKGKLVYSTCSLLHHENDGQIKQFLKNRTDAMVTNINIPWGLTTEHGIQTVPGNDETDGFYYSVLEKA